MSAHTPAVAIIGAGPVGKTAALLLAAYGVQTVLIEQRTEPSDEPKAISIDDEALRICATAGVLPRILPIIVPGLGTQYHDRFGRPLFLAGAAQSGRYGYPFKNPFAQPDLEAVLHDAVSTSDSIELLLGHRLASLEETEHGVSLAVERLADGASRSIVVDYVIGADGGRSTVRSLAGIGMTGRTIRENWVVIDTLEDPHDERFGLHYGTPERPHVIVPGLGGRCRYEFRLFDGEGEAGTEPDFALLRRLVDPYRDLEPQHVERAVIYAFHALNADTYQTERVFIAGDAAHMMPPFAGQGLNSGMRDVMNLTWKIAGVLGGSLAPAALVSYTPERRPHAGDMIRLSERLGTVVMTTRGRTAAWRDRLVGEALADPERRTWFEAMKYRRTAQYTEGLVAGDHPAIGLQLPQPRAFDAVAGRIALLDEFTGQGFALIGVNVDTAAWYAVDATARTRGWRRVQVQVDRRMPRGLDADALLADVDGALVAAFAPLSDEPRFVLLRPDRFVAAAWAPGESAAALDAVAPWFPAS